MPSTKQVQTTRQDFDGGLDGEKTVGVLVTQGVSLFMLLAAIEPLRTVNRLVGRSVYKIELVSLDGENLTASNGLIVPIASPLTQNSAFDVAIVGITYEQSVPDNNEISKWLRFQVSNDAIIVGLDIGVTVMARAGLLQGYKVAASWELLPSLQEEFPDLDITEQLYCIDRNRMTSSGPTAPLDMMLVHIHAQHGDELAIAVAHELTMSEVRNGHEPQRKGFNLEPWVRHKKLADFVEVMMNNLENPISIGQIANESRISISQIRRLCAKHMETSPARFYLDLRLRRSRELILYSTLQMTEIAQACGFSSSSTFARAFHAHFSIPPSEYRRRFQLNLARPYIEPTKFDVNSNGLFPIVGGAIVP